MGNFPSSPLAEVIIVSLQNYLYKGTGGYQNDKCRDFGAVRTRIKF